MAMPPTSPRAAVAIVGTSRSKKVDQLAAHHAARRDLGGAHAGRALPHDGAGGDLGMDAGEHAGVVDLPPGADEDVQAPDGDQRRQRPRPLPGQQAVDREADGPGVGR